MKWRVLVLLITGIAMIYLVSLLQDVPYPHPRLIQTYEPKLTRENEPRHVILSETNEYIYRTHIHHEAAIDTERGFIRGVDFIKLNVYGLITQARKKKNNFLNQSIEAEEWEDCFKHILRGPITKVSKSPLDSEAIQFAALYHTVEDNNIRHYSRVYYLFDSKFEYKDLLLPGTTMIDAFSLEQDSILYSRNPDTYRFRIATLPENLILPPHSKESSVITLTKDQTGDPVKLFHQPRTTESHANLLCRLYSPNKETYRVFSLDVHKTKYFFHTNVSIVDSMPENKWILRDHLNTNDSTILDESLEYMAFVDGAHFHQERTFINMPSPSISRSRDAKTMVVSLLKNNFQTLDYTNNLSALMNNPNEKKYLYKAENGDILPEFYHMMQVPDSVESSESAYDAADIKGVQLNSNGTLLAVWTESNSVYIYKRGLDSLTASSPHDLERPLEWILKMVITPKEGQLGSITPVGDVLFWVQEGKNYIAVGMKNHVVNTYLMDEIKEQPAVNFSSFIKNKWDLWIVMCTIVTIFVVNEYKSYPI